MKKAGTVLMYNCSGPEFSKLKQIFAMLRLLMRPVTPDKYHLTLKDLELGKGEAGESCEAFPEPMLVFCGTSGALVQQVLEIIRLSKMPPMIKAMMTDDNQGWDSKKLYEELVKERDALTTQN